MLIWTVFFVLMRRTHAWSLSKHFRNNLYIKNPWKRGAVCFILIYVGGAKMHNAMLHDFPALQVFPRSFFFPKLTYVGLRYDWLRRANSLWIGPYQKVHTTVTSALLRSWKKTPIGIRGSVSKIYVTLFGAAANWGLEWLFVEVPRPHTQLDTQTNTHTHKNTHTHTNTNTHKHTQQDASECVNCIVSCELGN